MVDSDAEFCQADKERALIFHHYWTVSDPTAARTDASSFFGHLSMMGGMLFVAAFGAGAFSVDA